MILMIISAVLQKHEVKCFRTAFLPSRIKSLNAISPSRVEPDDEPTPSFEGDPIEEIDASTVEVGYDENCYPIPDQPWRRGDTDGCEDPIVSSWRMEAEELIRFACSSVNAVVYDITWGMSHCIITISDTSQVEGTIEGPEVEIDMGEWYDGSSKGTGPDYFSNPEEEMSEEEMADRVEKYPASLILDMEDPLSKEREAIDPMILRAVGDSIRETLGDPDVEERLRVLSRHQILLTDVGAENYLNTQKEFDSHRGFQVAVETRDPWKSNRTLKGIFVDRNALDIILNIDGNLVTIPQNFVYRVKLLSKERV